MSRRMLFFIICLLLAFAEIAGAQVTGPTYTFTAFTTISPDEVNTNFTNIYGNALNRFAGVMGGNLTWSVDATYDVGASGGSRMRDLFVGRDVAIVRNETVGGTLGVTGAATLSSTLAVTGNATVGGTLGVTGATTLSAALSGTSASFSSTLGVTGATTLSSTLGVTGTSTLGVVNASGLLTLSGSAPEVSLTNGTANYILWANNGVGAPTFSSRSAGTKLVLHNDVGASAADFALGIESSTLWFSVPTTGNVFKWYGGTTLWAQLDGAGLTLTNSATAPTLKIGSSGAPSTFNGKIDVYNAGAFAPLEFYDSSGAADQKYWQLITGTGAFILRQVNDASSLVFDPLTITRTGYNSAAFALNGAVAYTGTQDVTLSAGNNNNVTINANTATLRVVTSGGSQNTITGLTGGTSGRDLNICQVGGTQSMGFSPGDANSTASNRIACAVSGCVGFTNAWCEHLKYDAGLSLWLRQ